MAGANTQFSSEFPSGACGGHGVFGISHVGVGICAHQFWVSSLLRRDRSNTGYFADDGADGGGQYCVGLRLDIRKVRSS